MSEFRRGQAAALLGVSPDTVRRLADAGQLETHRTAGGHRVVEGRTLARFVAEHTGLPAAGAIVGQSARNRFPGILTRVVKDQVAAQVAVQAAASPGGSPVRPPAPDAPGPTPGTLRGAGGKCAPRCPAARTDR